MDVRVCMYVRGLESSLVVELSPAVMPLMNPAFEHRVGNQLRSNKLQVSMYVGR
jgi:hypothetical protein